MWILKPAAYKILLCYCLALPALCIATTESQALSCITVILGQACNSLDVSDFVMANLY